MKSKGFTIIELMIVLAIIGIAFELISGAGHVRPNASQGSVSCANTK